MSAISLSRIWQPQNQRNKDALWSRFAVMEDYLCPQNSVTHIFARVVLDVCLDYFSVIAKTKYLLKIRAGKGYLAHSLWVSQSILSWLHERVAQGRGTAIHGERRQQMQQEPKREEHKRENTFCPLYFMHSR